VGGALGIWAPSLLIVLPLGALVFFTLGYASVTTISVALFATLVFAVRAWQGNTSWLDAWYGVAALLLLLWALRPNLRKLFRGEERVVRISLHGLIKARREQDGSHKSA
jgi:glycerol-3-phosphate acyltransferase PlsY